MINLCWQVTQEPRGVTWDPRQSQSHVPFWSRVGWVSAGRQASSCDPRADICEDRGLQDRERCLRGWDKPTPHRLGLAPLHQAPLSSWGSVGAKRDTQCLAGALLWANREYKESEEDEDVLWAPLSYGWGSSRTEMPQPHKPNFTPFGCPEPPACQAQALPLLAGLKELRIFKYCSHLHS